MSVRVEHGDSRDVVRSLADGSLDACVTDPPYSLVSIQKRFGKPGSAPAISEGATGVYKRASAGFMGKQWDTGETAFDPDFWREIYRALKPGAHVVAFAGTRTYHRLACAIEDAGFEIRDQLAWMYGSGFPKSHDVRKGLSKTPVEDLPPSVECYDDIARWAGWGTALKPAWEPIVFARKPLAGTVAANVLQHGTGAINVDGCRVATDETIRTVQTPSQHAGTIYGADQRTRSVFEGHSAGRWPANVLHDGSEEVLEAFAAYGEKGAAAPIRGTEPSVPAKGDVVYGFRQRVPGAFHADTGTAARFFFSAKADADDRIGSKHPTVKPVALMRWLVRLVTPKGGLVLDPFAGTGTTGVACIREGMRAILVEREDEYVADIRRRLAMLSGLDTPLLAGAAD